MDQYIAGGRTYAPNIPRFFKAARQNDSGVRAQMAMARQGEPGRQGFYSLRDATKIGGIDPSGHISL
jgi:hypothetical protein